MMFIKIDVSPMIIATVGWSIFLFNFSVLSFLGICLDCFPLILKLNKVFFRYPVLSSEFNCIQLSLADPFPDGKYLNLVSFCHFVAGVHFSQKYPSFFYSYLYLCLPRFSDILSLSKWNISIYRIISFKELFYLVPPRYAYTITRYNEFVNSFISIWRGIFRKEISCMKFSKSYVMKKG